VPLVVGMPKYKENFQKLITLIKNFKK